MAIYDFRDLFTDTAGVDLDAHTPNTDVSGNGWTQQIGNWEISTAGTTNAAAAQAIATDGTSSVAIATCDVSDANPIIQLSSVLRPSSRGNGIAFRYVDANNYWCAFITDVGDVLTLRKREAGSNSTIGSYSIGGTYTNGTAYAITVDLSGGDDISVSLDGTERITTNSSFNNAATAHGLYSDQSTTFGLVDTFVINEAEVTPGANGPAVSSAEILNTSRANTAQAGAGTTITLDASASAVDDFYNGCRIVTTGGTGSGQTRTITDYNGTTKVATVATWDTNPDVTTTFDISSGNHLAITFDKAATYNTGQATLKATPIVGQTAKRECLTVPDAELPVIRGDGTTTVVFLVRDAMDGYPGLGTPINKGESSVTLDLPAGFVRNGADSNLADTDNAVTNSSENSSKGTCRIRHPMVRHTFAGTLTIEAEAFSHFASGTNDGVTSLAYTVSDGSNPDVTGSLTRAQTSAIGDGWKVWGASAVDISGLDDGALTLTVTATYDWTAETRSDSITIYNNNGGGLDATNGLYYVSTSGNDTTGDGSTGTPYRNIGKAFDQMRADGDAGGTVRIKDAGNWNMQEGGSGSIWNNTRPLIIEPDPAAGLADTDVVIYDDNSGLYAESIRGNLSGFVIFRNLKININNAATDGYIAQIVNSHVFDNVLVSHDGSSSPAVSATTSWNGSTAYTACAYNSAVDQSLKGFSSYLRVINCTVARTASDTLANCLYVSHLEVDRRSYGVPMFSVQYTGAAADATIELSDVAAGGTFTLKEDGSSVATFDTQSASYDTVTELVAAIDAVADWTATDLTDATDLQDTREIYSFAAASCKASALSVWVNSDDHSDFSQIFGSGNTYENVIWNGIQCVGSYVDTPGLNPVQQVFWLDHAGPLKIHGLAIVNCLDVTWGTSGGQRSGIHSDIRDALIGWNSLPDNQWNLIYKGGGTANSYFSPTNVVFAYNWLDSIILESTGVNGDGSDIFLYGNCYVDNTGGVTGVDDVDTGAITTEATTYSRPTFDLTPLSASSLVDVYTNTVQINDATGAIRTGTVAGALQPAASGGGPTEGVANPDNPLLPGAFTYTRLRNGRRIWFQG